MRRIIVGVMGPGEKCSKQDGQRAFELGALIAKNGWVLLSGGRNVGAMNEANRGAKSQNGLTIGIIPRADPGFVSEFVDVPIYTDLGSARNNINVLSCNAIISLNFSTPGTLSEVALALKAKKNVVLLSDDKEAVKFVQKMAPTLVYVAKNPKEAIEITKRLLR
ncbi:MAG: cytochrome [Candidatus Micrarchaeia archaeon]|jgi:hypothetical protein